MTEANENEAKRILPGFIEDDSIEFDVPTKITRATGRELLGRRPGETLDEALERVRLSPFATDEMLVDLEVPENPTLDSCRELFGRRPDEPLEAALARRAPNAAEEEPFFIPGDWKFDGELPTRICRATDYDPDPSQSL